jgi:hypothetical protein
MGGSTLFFLVRNNPEVVSGISKLTTKLVASDVILCFAILCTQSW